MNVNFKKSVRSIYRQTSSKNQFRFLLLGGVAGIFAAIAAIAFRESISAVTRTLYGIEFKKSFILGFTTPHSLWPLIVYPVIIGGFVAWFTKRFAPESQGHGVPEIMSAVIINRGLLKARVIIVKLLASALSIGSGFSVGREGPSAIIGASVGSTLGKWMHLPPSRMKMMVGAGTAAGIAAIFNAPLAGTVFALELIVRNISVRDITPIIFSAMVATVISHYWYGDFHELFTRINLSVHHPIEILFYAGLGLFVGAAGILFTKLLYKAEERAEKVELPSYVKGAIGGISISIILIFFPLVSGPANWEAINIGMTEIDSGKAATFILILALLKLVVTPISLASGASGGVFAPSLMIGGSLGAVYGFLVHKLFPSYTTSPGGYALIGMGALVAAVTQAPLTAITIIFEMTHNMSIILPMLVSSGIAVGLFIHFMPGSIYTIKLQRRGINIELGRERGILEGILVKEVMEKADEFCQVGESVAIVLDRFEKSARSTLPVIDSQNKLLGVVSFWDLKQLGKIENMQDKIETVMKTNPEITHPNKDLFDVFIKISSGDYEYIPVVDNTTNMRLIGKLSRTKVLQVYKNKLTSKRVDFEEDSK